MDEEWAVERLQWWVATASSARQRDVSRYSAVPFQPWGLITDPRIDMLREREDQTTQILQRILSPTHVPALLSPLDSESVSLQSGIDAAKAALGILATRGETAAKLGSDAPTMKADALHPLIWGAASKHWDVGHYAAAVQRAATMLNAEVQDRVDRHDVSDSALMQQTFSDKAPEAGKPRLRWPGEDSDLTVRAMRQGILNMSQGVFSAIRNPATHSTEDMERQEALEQLATLSILARWIERCELVSA